MLSPSIRSLESAMFTTLRKHFEADPKIIVAGVHPRTKVDQVKNKCYLVLSQVSESMEGRVITTKLLRPLMQIAIYAVEYLTVRQYQEQLVELFNTQRTGLNYYSGQFIPMLEQRIEWLYIERRSPPVLDLSTELFVGSVDIKIHLSAL